jgi:hypothetical protein
MKLQTTSLKQICNPQEPKSFEHTSADRLNDDKKSKSGSLDGLSITFDLPGPTGHGHATMENKDQRPGSARRATLSLMPNNDSNVSNAANTFRVTASVGLSIDDSAPTTESTCQSATSAGS